MIVHVAVHHLGINRTEFTSRIIRPGQEEKKKDNDNAIKNSLTSDDFHRYLFLQVNIKRPSLHNNQQFNSPVSATHQLIDHQSNVVQRVHIALGNVWPDVAQNKTHCVGWPVLGIIQLFESRNS